MPEPALMSRRSPVDAFDVTPDGVACAVDGGVRVILATPDGAAARRAARTAIRITAVELSERDGELSAELVAVWHRLPQRQPLSVDAAVAFALGGVPTFLTSSTGDPAGAQP